MSYQADDYSKKQAIKDAAYEREYEAWVKAMTPEQRYQARQLGVGEALLPGDCGGFLDEDAADTPMAATPAAEIADAQPPAETTMEAEQVWDILRRLIGELLAERNARLTLECLALVSGMSFLGDSQAAIARRHGVTRAAVSKRCIELTERLNVLPSRAMRSLTARRAYQEAQINLRHDYERFGQHHA